MRLFCVLRRGKSDFIGGVINGDLHLTNSGQFVLKSPIWKAFKMISDSNRKTIKSEQYTPILEWFEQNVDTDAADADAIDTIINRIKTFARAHQIWIHNKSALDLWYANGCT